MRSMCSLYSTILCKDSLCSQMHPVVLSAGSLFQGINRRHHNVCNSIQWTGSQRRGKVSHLRLINYNEKTNSHFGINNGAKRSENLHTVPLLSASYNKNDEVLSTTRYLLESGSGGPNHSNDHCFKASDSEQHQKTYKQLGSLDSYFSKLHGKGDEEQNFAIAPDHSVPTDVSTVEVQPNLDKPLSTMTPVENHSTVEVQSNPDKSLSTVTPPESQSIEEDKTIKRKTDLNMLDSYFEKINAGSKDAPKDALKDDMPKVNKSDKTRNSLTTEEDEFARELLNIMSTLEKHLESDKKEKASKLKEQKKEVFDGLLPLYDGSYNFFLINALVALNIAVYLFELASPVGSSDIGSVSLPLLYGAKINELIMDGQWWRLITPMFLHSGLLHVAFSSWALLTFGPLVDRAYGSFAYCMIYFLGGVCGNLMSFFHTPDATIGGTGPVFAVIGSWVVCLLQNREAIGEDIADNMIQKVVLAGVISVALSFLTPIDDWTHLGAACAGVIFGALVCPILPVNASSKKLLSDPADDGQQGFLLVSEGPDFQRLLTVFSLFVAILATLFFVLAPMITEFQLSNISDSF